MTKEQIEVLHTASTLARETSNRAVELELITTLRAVELASDVAFKAKQLAEDATLKATKLAQEATNKAAILAHDASIKAGDIAEESIRHMDSVNNMLAGILRSIDILATRMDRIEAVTIALHTGKLPSGSIGAPPYNR